MNPSLLLIPDRYKAAKLYSQIPDSGDGDLTFARASVATRFNASGLIESVASGVPRLDYPVSGGCPSLLLEPQRTNLVTFSEEFDNAAWSKLNTTIDANNSIAPDGQMSADLIYPTTSGTDRLVEQLYIGYSIGTTFTMSFFVKSAGFDWCVMTGPTLGDSWFNTTTGQFGTVGAGVTAKNLGLFNGYWRISLTGNIQIPTAVFYAGVADANGSKTATKSGTNGLLFWGAQMEIGSYPTSYIPSLGSSVTRLADAASKTGISSLIGQTEGTLFFEIPPQNFRESDFQTLFIIYNQTGLDGKYFHLYKDTGGLTLTFQVFDAVVQCVLNFTLSQNIRYKVAAVYKTNRFELWVNGTMVASDLIGTVASNVYDKMEFGQDSFNSNSQIICSQGGLFKDALTNAELATLTTL